MIITKLTHFALQLDPPLLLFVNGADVFPLNMWHISSLRTKPLLHLKEPRKAYSQGYHNDIWATSNTIPLEHREGERIRIAELPQ